MSQKPNGKFNKRKLPYPIQVLTMLGIHRGKINRKDYFVIICPFHKNGQEIHPSLNVHQDDGHYLCHACGERGGDILDFYMLATGFDFVTAAKRLGAWEYDKCYH